MILNLSGHYVACSMAVVVGGITAAIELATLQRSFIHFPLENQFGQQLYVTARLAKLGASIMIRYFQTTLESPAQTIKANIRKEATWKPIA